jgi:hypothetical protein
MSDDSAHQKEIADLLPMEDDSAAPGQVPIVLGEVEPEKFLYVGKGLTADEFGGYVQSYDFGKIPPDYVVLHHTANPCMTRPGSIMCPLTFSSISCPKRTKIGTRDTAITIAMASCTTRLALR